MIEEILLEIEVDMESSLEALQNDFNGIRTGRASTALVDKLPVAYYGDTSILQSLAQTAVPEAQLITIRPYDPSSIQAIERAIQTSNLGLTPNNDGKIIRLQIPPLTEQRRRDLVKQVQSRLEDARVSIRNHRRNGISMLRDFEKEKEITQDELRSGQGDIQKLTDDYIKKADEIGKNKEDEIMSF